MKRIGAILLIAMPLMAGAQRAILSDLLATSSPSATPLAEEKIARFVQHLKPETSRSDIALLRKTFHRAQRTFLHEYSSYARFDEVFASGKYDCLTATSLFAIVLEHLKFNFRIVETNYHIFILVSTANEEVLLETTDRFGGFVRGQQAIDLRINSYRAERVNNEESKEYHYTFNLYHPVNVHQLPGLLYFNQAVKEYNAGGLEKCADLLTKAQSIYDSPRIYEFESILIKSVMESNLDVATKQRINKQLSARKSAVLASR